MSHAIRALRRGAASSGARWPLAMRECEMQCARHYYFGSGRLGLSTLPRLRGTIRKMHTHITMPRVCTRFCMAVKCPPLVLPRPSLPPNLSLLVTSDNRARAHGDLTPHLVDVSRGECRSALHWSSWRTTPKCIRFDMMQDMKIDPSRCPQTQSTLHMWPAEVRPQGDAARCSPPVTRGVLARRQGAGRDNGAVQRAPRELDPAAQ